MEYEFAPLEGVTDAVYRRTHRRFYPGLARYYTPFISPTQNHRFTPRDLRELAPENNTGLHLVPQLLGKNAADFLWAAEALAEKGVAARVVDMHTVKPLDTGCVNACIDDIVLNF